MTAFEVIMILVALASPITTIIGGLMVAHGSYSRLQSTVASLVKKMDDLSPQAGQIADLARTYAELAVKMAEVQRDIELIKSDLVVIRANQQRAAFDDPEKGRLDALRTSKGD